MVTLFVGDRAVAELPEDVFAAGETVEVRTADGRRLARLVPDSAAMAGQQSQSDGPWDDSAPCPWHPDWTWEELERRNGDGEGKPLAEILARLQAG